MIDDSDVDDWWMLSLVSSGPWALVTVAIMVVLWAVKCGNDDECAKMHCATGKPELLKHECLCVQEARP